MLEGSEDDEVDRFLDENTRPVPLFEINVIATPPKIEEELRELDHDAIIQLRQAQNTFEREMEVSRWVKSSTLKEIILGTV
mgnify:CR=1 FL=1